MGVSNNLIGILNSITAVLSIPIIGAGIWLATKHSTDCMRFLQWPIIIIGVFILLVSLAGLLGSCYRSPCLLWIYATVMFLLIILLFCFTVFAFVVTHKGAGNAVSGKGFDEFHLGNYSSWLQRQVNKASVWDKIESCLKDSKTCSKLNSKYTTVEEFNAAHLSPIQVFDLFLCSLNRHDPYIKCESSVAYTYYLVRRCNGALFPFLYVCTHS
ncbi:hypothetical protein KP509_30G027700 [Ceratopteris richardii]|uniref:Uncharacterized protein n=1 Tax=Ceratopteris richardii TaxID=49495 RepID=A0A8T2R0Y2_CERRI|nr:hypothetical protein KP509_30G027700 [Ceratopteris richardii]